MLKQLYVNPYTKRTDITKDYGYVLSSCDTLVDWYKLIRWCRKNNISPNHVSRGQRGIAVSLSTKKHDIQFETHIKYLIWLYKMGLHETYDLALP